MRNRHLNVIYVGSVLSSMEHDDHVLQANLNKWNGYSVRQTQPYVMLYAPGRNTPPLYGAEQVGAGEILVIALASRSYRSLIRLLWKVIWRKEVSIAIPLDQYRKRSGGYLSAKSSTAWWNR